MMSHYIDRIGKGNDQIWYHVNFLRGKPENMKLMVRTKIKGNLAFTRETLIDEPNFEDLPPLPACDKRPAAVLDVMEAVILKLPASASIAVDRCVSNKPTVSTPNLGNVTNHPMVLQRTETPFQLNMNYNQDECLPLLPPPFQRAVSNENQGQAMMTHFVPAMAQSYHSPLRVSSGSTPPSLEMHETSSQELQNHHAEYYHMLHGNLNCENGDGDDFEPLPFAFQDDNAPCDDFAAFIEGAIQQVGTR